MSNNVIGFTGAFATGNYSGSPANSTWGGNIRSWSASSSMDVIETTGFADSFETSKGGVFSMQGSASGNTTNGATGTAPSAFHTGRRVGVALTLTADTGCTYTGTALLSNINIGIEKRGEASITFDFRFTGTVTETWATS